MTQFSAAELYGMTIRESANDGSDFSNAPTDYRRLFLGEDGQLHVKDSAGAVTDIGATPSEITDIPTADTTTTNVLAPDGAGGVEWRAEAGGGAAASQVRYAGGSWTLTGDSAWHDLDATNAKLTIAAATGDILLFTLSAATDNAVFFDVKMQTSGTRISGGTTDTDQGMSGWGARSTADGVTGSQPWVVASGDISGGNVEARVIYRAAAAYTVYAIANIPFHFSVVNLGQ